MTVIVISPNQDGVLVAADTLGAGGFTGPFFRMRKVAKFGQTKVVCVNGQAQVLIQPDTPNPPPPVMVLDLLPAFLELTQGGLDPRAACVAIAKVYAAYNPPPVYNNYIAGINIISVDPTAGPQIQMFDFEYPRGQVEKEVECSVTEGGLNRAFVLGLPHVQTNIRDTGHADHALCVQLLRQELSTYFTQAIILANAQESLDAAQAYIRATKTYCDPPRNVAPMGERFDAFQVTATQVIELADDALA
jgi:hypothetical protein